MKDGQSSRCVYPGAARCRSEIGSYRVRQIYSAGAGVHPGQRETKGRDGLQSPIVKNLHDAALAAMLQKTGAPTATSFSADREDRPIARGRCAPG
jgi:aspartyl-tRNA synthetase